jgi:hypothetical protein
MSPWTDSEPQPLTVTVPPVMAAPARKYEAEEASPSVKICPGDLYVCPACVRCAERGCV